MPDKQIQHYLKRICESREFSNSESYQRLLRYLVSRSLQGETPKETTIAIDLFDKDASYNPAEDSTIRTHVYTLRKKLETYYLSEGAEDAVRLVIPRGHYKVEFQNRKPRKTPFAPRGLIIALSFLFLIAVSYTATFLLYQYTEPQNQPLPPAPVNQPHPVFDSLVQSTHPLLLVIGDYYIYKGGDSESGGERKIRDGGINSDRDFAAMLEKHPHLKDQYEITYGRYTANRVVNGAVKLIRWFESRKEFEISFASRIMPEQATSRDILFIGPFKTLINLEQQFQPVHFRYRHYPHQIIHTDSATDTIVYDPVEFDQDYYYKKDYALILKRRTASGRQALFITSFSPATSTALAEHLFSASFLSRIRIELLKKRRFPEQFELLLEVNFVDEKTFVTPLALYEIGLD
ncbi:MAG: helix-turn-helix domain-containing protein [candidate division KSB1 bacterium]|nr:helix-turn-helix domain-containing protein [candidate division KSB1 bacterium]